MEDTRSNSLRQKTRAHFEALLKSTIKHGANKEKMKLETLKKKKLKKDLIEEERGSDKDTQHTDGTGKVKKSIGGIFNPSFEGTEDMEHDSSHEFKDSSIDRKRVEPRKKKQEKVAFEDEIKQCVSETSESMPQKSVTEHDSSDSDCNLQSLNKTQIQSVLAKTKVTLQSKMKTKYTRQERQNRKLEMQVMSSQKVDIHSYGGSILGVMIHYCDALELDFLLTHPVVKVHVVSSNTSTYVKKQQIDRAVTSYYESSNIKFIQPQLTQPYDFRRKRSVIPKWEELIVFNEDVDYLLQNDCILFFEIMDFVSMDVANTQYSKLGCEGGWHKVAWGFLKLRGANGVMNIKKKLRLQLYRPLKRQKIREGDIEVLRWWMSTSRVMYPSTLYVTVKEISVPETVEPAIMRSMAPMQPEIGTHTGNAEDETSDVKASQQSTITPSIVDETSLRWMRLKGQPCRIPNQLFLTLPTSSMGCMTLRFNNSGTMLAAGCAQEHLHFIRIYKIPSGLDHIELEGHYGLIYSVDWSGDDSLLISGSSDSTSCVWKVDDAKVYQVLPHPSFVYCAHFHSNHLIATGCYDHMVRIWIKGENGFQLHEELECHGSCVNALCWSLDGRGMYTGDGEGVVKVWNVDEESHAELIKSIELDEMSGVPVNAICVHPGGSRLLVHYRDGCLRMINLNLYCIMKRYTGFLNYRMHIGSGISPCGGIVLSGSEDCCAYLWDTDSAVLLHTFSQLGYKDCVSSLHYHPSQHMIAFSSYGSPAPLYVYIHDPPPNNKPTVSPIYDSTHSSLSPRLGETENVKVECSVGIQSSDSFERARFEQITIKLTNALTFVKDTMENKDQGESQYGNQIIDRPVNDINPTDSYNEDGEPTTSHDESSPQINNMSTPNNLLQKEILEVRDSPILSPKTLLPHLSPSKARMRRRALKSTANKRSPRKVIDSD